MTMLSAEELIQLRADVAELLPDTCRIERPTSTNTFGNAEESWSTAVVSAACRLDPDTDRRNMETIGEQEAGVARYILSLPYDTDVAEGDRVVMSAVNYEITQIHSDHTNRIVRRLRVSRILGS